MDRIARDQIREKMIAADLDDVRASKNKLVSALLEACQRELLWTAV